jgi:hypothetical protein
LNIRCGELVSGKKSRQEPGKNRDGKGVQRHSQIESDFFQTRDHIYGENEERPSTDVSDKETHDTAG